MTIDVADWPTLHAVGWTAHQARYGLLETRSAVISQYQGALVPGLLQTKRYATIILRDVVGVRDSQLAEAVSARLRRQQVLTQPSTEYAVVVTENMLRHRMGGPDVMAEQMEHIADVIRSTSIDFSVLPVGGGMREAYGLSFVMYDFPDGDRLVVAETTSGELREDRPSVVERYAREWETYRAAAIDGGHALALVEGIAAEARHAASAQRREGRSAGHSQAP